MLAIVPSATLLGAEGRPVSVEVHVANGLPAFSVVGLPDEACRESRDRVRAALLSSGLPWPMTRITVNLAPSGVRKSGAGLDLAIAVGVLVAAEAVPADAVHGLAFLGELGLDGSVRRVPGIVPLVAALDGPVAGRAAGVRSRGGARRPAGGPVGPQPGRAGRRARRAAHRGPTRRRRRRPSGSEPRCPTWPTCGARPWPASPSRPQRPVATTSSCSGHRARARPCWPSASPALLPALGRDVALETTMIHSAAGLPLPGRARPPATAAGAAPHRVARGHGRRRHGQHAPRRGLAGQRRGAVPGRARRVPAGRPGRASPAARGRRRPGDPGAGVGAVPGPLPARSPP